ncbi:MAG: RtcB family protein, partial [Lachnospiraceae bacterium]|nr:RtcB family protein [Lachnospiraceae bacterium]
ILLYIIRTRCYKFSLPLQYYLSEGQKLLKARGEDIPYELTYLEDSLMSDYLHDLKIVQDFAALNREIMLDEIIKGMKWKTDNYISCIHNYVDFSTETPIIRKGAVSAKENEPVIIPINMRDGVILGTGLGNEDWNVSAPHGAGRIMKREEVKANFTLSNFKSEMKGIYSSCINKDTLDEAPFAYRSIDSITDIIKETVSIDKILSPVYNYKAGSTR